MVKADIALRYLCFQPFASAAAIQNSVLSLCQPFIPFVLGLGVSAEERHEGGRKRPAMLLKSPTLSTRWSIP